MSSNNSDNLNAPTVIPPQYELPVSISQYDQVDMSKSDSRVNLLEIENLDLNITHSESISTFSTSLSNQPLDGSAGNQNVVLTQQSLPKKKKRGLCPSVLDFIPVKYHSYVPFYNMFLFSFSSLILFSCFSTTQSLMSTIFKEVGFYSLAILYVAFSFGNFIAPTVDLLLTPKFALLVAGVPYALYILSAAIPWYIPSTIALLVMGFVCGLGSALYWVAHGDFMVRNARFMNKNRMGIFSGLFFSIFSLNGFCGNIINALLILWKVPQWLQFTILSIGAFIGVSIQFLLINMPLPDFDESKEANATHEPIVNDKKTIIQSKSNELITSLPIQNINLDSKNEIFDQKDKSIQQIDHADFVLKIEEGLNSTQSNENKFLKMFKNLKNAIVTFIKVFFDLKMLLSIPIFIYSGATLGFFFGNIPPLFGKEMVPWVMAAFSLSSCIYASILSQLTRFISKRMLMTFTLLLHLFALILTLTFNFATPYSYFWAMIVCGISDSSLNTMIYANLGTYFEKNSAEGFAVFKFEQSFSAGVAFYSGSLLDGKFHITQIIMFILLGLAMLSFLIVEFIISPVDQFGKRDPEEVPPEKVETVKLSPSTEDFDYGATSISETGKEENNI